jgi:hypothetical protein
MPLSISKLAHQKPWLDRSKPITWALTVQLDIKIIRFLKDTIFKLIISNKKNRSNKQYKFMHKLEG